MSGLFRSALVYTFTNIVNSAIPFLLVPVLTRVLSPEEYGTVAMFNMVVAVLAAFTGLSVHGAVNVRYFQRDSINFYQYVSTCLSILAVSTIAVYILTSMLGQSIVEFTKVPVKWIHIAVIVSGAQFVIHIRLVIWQVQGFPWRYGLFQIIQSLLNVSLSLWLVLVAGMSWEGRVSGQSIAIIVIFGTAFLSLARGGYLSCGPSSTYAKDALKFGVPLIAHGLGGLLISMTDRVMISNMLDVSQTGIYIVALQFGMVLGVLADAFNKAYSPWLFKQLKDNLHDQKIFIVKLTYSYFLIAICLSVILAASAPYIVSTIAGKSFAAASRPLLYIAIGYAFCGMYYMVANYIFYANKTYYLPIITFFSGVVNVLLAYPLIKIDGIEGAAKAFMISNATMFFLTWVLSARSYRMPWFYMFDRQHLSRRQR